MGNTRRPAQSARTAKSAWRNSRPASSASWPGRRRIWTHAPPENGTERAKRMRAGVRSDTRRTFAKS